MEPLAKLFVSLLELAESELAALKGGVIRLGLSLAFIAGAAVTGVIGLTLVLAAAYLLLQELLGTPAALAISGLLFLTATAVLGLLAFRKAKATIQQLPADAKAAAAAYPVHPHDPSPTIRIAS